MAEEKKRHGISNPLSIAHVSVMSWTAWKHPIERRRKALPVSLLRILFSGDAGEIIEFIDFVWRQPEPVLKIPFYMKSVLGGGI